MFYLRLALAVAAGIFAVVGLACTIHSINARPTTYEPHYRESEPQNCGVCQEPLRDRKIRLGCSHEFHLRCLGAVGVHESKKCPYTHCREVLYDTDLMRISSNLHFE